MQTVTPEKFAREMSDANTGRRCDLYWLAGNGDVPDTTVTRSAIERGIALESAMLEAYPNEADFERNIVAAFTAIGRLVARHWKTSGIAADKKAKNKK